MNPLSGILLCLLLSNGWQGLYGACILAVFPYPGPSQYILVQPFLKALTTRGHKVTTINAFPQKEKYPNFRDIPVLEVHSNYEDLVQEAKNKRSIWGELNFISDFVTNITMTILRNPDVQGLFKNDQFDLIIIETYRLDLLYGLSQHFRAPLIGVSSYGNDPMIDDMVGNMSPFSYVPFMTLGLTERMNYKERMWNMVNQLMELFYAHFVHVPRHQKIFSEFFPNVTVPLSEIRKNFSLILLNQHFSLSFPRPYVPNMIEVGGFHLQQVLKPLPTEMQAFIDSSPEDVIYFSMGSNVKSKDLPKETIQKFVQTFRALPYRVMWKFEENTLPGKPKNLFISKWFPQSDILAHPRVKLFLTHGGLLSTIEAIYHAKPILGLPFFYDQFMNMARATEAGYGLALDLSNFTVDSLKDTILELLTNPKYSEKAAKKSQIYHDQPVKPLDLAIYWTEYVLRHKGPPHLRSPAQDLNFWQKHSIDTAVSLVATVVVVVCGVIIGILKSVRSIFEKISRNKIKQKIN